MNETNPLLQRRQRQPRTLYEAIAPEDFETDEGLAKIQSILDSIEAADEQNLPSLFSSSSRKILQRHQQQRCSNYNNYNYNSSNNSTIGGHSKGSTTTTKTGYVIWSALLGVSVLVIATIVILSAARLIVPTPAERAVAQHYYGDEAVSSSSSSSSLRRIRQAQDQADAAFTSRSSSRYLEDRRSSKKTSSGSHFYSTVQRETLASSSYADDDDDYPAAGHGKDLYDGCESTVLILRHCEKSDVAEHCAYDGFERSFYLSTLFGERWPVPYEIYAERPAERNNPDKRNFREVETVGPTGLKFDIPIDQSYSSVRPLAHAIWDHVESGTLCGRLVVVAWKHSDIAELGRFLGCGPMQGCPFDYHGKTFDDAWQIKFVYRRWPHSERKHHFSVPDSDKPPAWRVFGSVQQERFDPLAVSYQSGGYRGPDGKQPRWRENVTDIPERKNGHDNHVKYDEANIWLQQVHR
jgi:hypothetical protein